MKNLSLTGVKDQFKRLGHFFFAHSQMIYFVLFLSVLIGTIIGLNVALYQPSDETYRSQKLSEAQSARFDTDTIQKIQNLNSRQQTTTDAVPAGTRSNPFGE